MEEKRKAPRKHVELDLNVSSLFKQDNVLVNNIDAPVEVTDVSRLGIGFKSAAVLPVGFYFNAALELGSKDNILYCVVKIIRQEPLASDGRYKYGCEYVGLPSVFSYVFDEFENE